MEEKFSTTEYNDDKIIFLKTIVDDSYAFDYVNNTFCIFNSINQIFYLIYSNEDCSIISYDLNENKVINEIKNAHNEYITSFRHFFDKKQKRDIILSISNDNNNVKLWNINNFELIFDFKNINSNGKISSSCFLLDNNQNYVLISNGDEYEPIKAFNFNGEKIKEIKDSNDMTFFIDVYYDNKSSTNYVITTNSENVKSFDFRENKLYNKYKEDDDDRNHKCVFIYEKENIIRVIDIDDLSNLRIWNFHTGELMDKIILNLEEAFDILLLNERYFAFSCIDKGIILYDCKENKVIISDKYSNEKCILTIKKIYIKKYGECIISQGTLKECIQLWRIKC